MIKKKGAALLLDGSGWGEYIDQQIFELQGQL